MPNTFTDNTIVLMFLSMGKKRDKLDFTLKIYGYSALQIDAILNAKVSA